MTAAENNAKRLQLILQMLADNPDGLDKSSALFPAVFERVALEGAENDIVSGGKLRGESNLVWSSVDFVKAGWIEKNGNGLWKITSGGREALQEFPNPIDLSAEAHSRYDAWSAASTAQKQEQLRTTIVAVDADEELIRDAALPFVERGLQNTDSVFAPGRQAWSPGPVRELRAVFIDSPDPDAGNFVDKLKLQMAHVSDDARLLMAELVCWQLLPISPRTIGERAKKERVQTLLGYMDHPVQIPAEVSRGFKAGSFNPGPAMSNKLYEALVLIITLLEAWLEKTELEREALLSDAWAWRGFVNQIPGHSFRTQRNSLIYLVHPQSITSIVSEDHKVRIRDAFIGEIGAPSDDVDRDLLGLILKLQEKSGTSINFYEPPYLNEWNQQLATEQLKLIGAEDGESSEDLAAAATRRRFPPADQTLAESLFIERAWLQKQLDLLERRRQIIFYGPPGTGKTFVSLKIAEYVAGDPRYTEIVQFHPSYSYEDFFQGYRPTTSESGSLTYRLQDGPLRRIVDQAVKNPEFNYVLVIDEINRGNLAKIFGELYFLLEYRDKPIKLQYSSDADDSFALPSNLFLIGTMNTSDRSIALLDAAMRRRFAFVELHPEREPVRSVLEKWLRGRGASDQPAVLLRALNGRIADADFQIGPSYLMAEDASPDGSHLDLVWEHEILPLLEEYHYGESINVEEVYGLPALRAELKRRSQEEAGEFRA